jgi:hypothetical protein
MGMAAVEPRPVVRPKKVAPGSGIPGKARERLGKQQKQARQKSEVFMSVTSNLVELT